MCRRSWREQDKLYSKGMISKQEFEMMNEEKNDRRIISPGGVQKVLERAGLWGKKGEIDI